jgi:hypothetical protein
MKFVRHLLLSAPLLSLLACNPLAPEVVSRDCTIDAVPATFTRIYIGVPHAGRPQSGTSAEDPLDGTTAQKFDTILRTIAEGQHPSWGAQQNMGPENVIVCIGNGTFQTEGQFDYVMSVGHTLGSPRGFTVARNWKVHGRGTGRTILQLASFVPDTFTDKNGATFTAGHNVAIGTTSESSSGVEVSDLTIDANHDRLTSPGGLPLNLAGVQLRSHEGGHWIHDVNIIGGSGDAGLRNIRYETFAIQVWGDLPNPGLEFSSGNLIENVTVSKPGRPMSNGDSPGGALDGIVINGAAGEVRNNLVDEAFIGLGGWAMDHVSIHDNITRNTSYGFNADSLVNNSITLKSNQFIHPREYGIIMGGGNTFANWTVAGNIITLNVSNSIGMGLQGEVQNSTFTGNIIQSDSPIARNMVAIMSFANAPGVSNFNNVFQDNRIDRRLIVDFSQDPHFNTDCRHQNRDLQGAALQGFPDNSGANCP